MENRYDPLAIETTIHGRVLVRAPEAEPAAGLLVAFHGYAQSAEDMVTEIERIPGTHRWRIASVQGLHRFYSRRDQRVVASWMTRQDRDRAIVDNVAYVARAVRSVRVGTEPIVFVGFSQGASMAYRAAVLGPDRAAGIVAVAGDVPPELKQPGAPERWPPVLIGVGSDETWYSTAKVEADMAFLHGAGVQAELVRFAGGHEWTDELRIRVGRWIDQAR